MKSLKLLLLFTFLGLGIMNVDGQRSFAHSFGGELIVGGDASNAGALMYSPRINFLTLGSSTLSFGTHLGLGAAFNTNSISGSSTTFAYDLPLVIEYNIGGGSGANSEGGFGFYLGGGYGFSKITSSGFNTSGNNTAKGPVVNGGFRFSYQDKPAGLKTSLLFDTTDGGSRVFTIGGFYTLSGKEFGGGSGGSSKKTRKRR